MTRIDFKKAISDDVAEIDLVLCILKDLRDTNLARLAVLQEAEKRCASEPGNLNKEA
jgi:hypothetical protein